MADLDQELEGFFDEGVEDLAQSFDTSDSFTDDASMSDDVAVEEPIQESTEVMPKMKAELGSVDSAFDFGGLMSMPGVVVGTAGIKVDRYPVERMKFTKGSKSMISILSDQVVVCKTHYKEGLGNFLCFGGECCDRDLPRIRYVFPIAVYDTDAKGKPISTEMRNAAFVVGKDTYDALMDIRDLKGSLSQFDLLVSCSDEQYQKITIQEAGLARYKKSKNAVREIEEFWAKNAKNILKSTARSITPAEFREEESTANMSTGADVDFNDVFNS